MVSQDKLIKQGIKYTNSLFDVIIAKLMDGVKETDTLESFLENTKEYTTNNPLVATGYDATMIELILAETNNHKFTRPAQKELVRLTIQNYVGHLITNVGEDIKQNVREIVEDGYDKGLSQYEIADNINENSPLLKEPEPIALPVQK